MANVYFYDWDGTILSHQYTSYLGSATPPADPTREGYRFTGWDGTYTLVQSDQNVYATYIKVWTVTFFDYDGRVISEQTVDEKTSATAPEDPTRSGYTFTGWDEDYTYITSDTTIIATYSRLELDPNPEEIYYEVTFVDYDGTVLFRETVIETGDATPPDDPVREGYTFIGWDGDYTDVTSNLTITAQYVLTSADSTAHNGVKIQAMTYNSHEVKSWIHDGVEVFTAPPDTFTVTFVDGDTILSTQTIAYGCNATSPTNPTKEGHRFTGWSGVYTNITSDVTIEATWIQTFTVTFVDYDGDILDTQTVDINGSATAPANPTRSGYTFNGWSGSYTNVTGDVTITATYSKNVSYVDINVVPGSEVESYTFDGAFYNNTAKTHTVIEGSSHTIVVYPSNTKLYKSQTYEISSASTVTLPLRCIMKTLKYTYSSITKSYSVYSIGELTEVESIQIPSTYDGYPVTKIENGAFKNCTNLTAVLIGDNVTYIGKNAFNGCTNLKSIFIGSNVNTIGSYAFAYTAVTYPTIPASVTQLGTFTFAGCTLSNIQFGVNAQWRGYLNGTASDTYMTTTTSPSTELAAKLGNNGTYSSYEWHLM